MRSREGRLKPEYAEWYPGIEPGVWHHAAWLAEKVLQQQRHGSPAWTLGDRPLSDEHFDFQGRAVTSVGTAKRGPRHSTSNF